MVFHEIERLSEVLSGHRIIIYYIREDESTCKLYKSVEYVMDMLGKKNDDLLIFKVAKNTPQFGQFKELYKPEISAKIALFAINSEGLPMICKQIYNEESINEAFTEICKTCQLNSISKTELTKAKCLNSDEEKLNDINRFDTYTNGYKNGPAYKTSQIPSCDNNVLTENSISGVNNERQEDVQSITKVTKPQISLPDDTIKRQEHDQSTTMITKPHILLSEDTNERQEDDQSITDVTELQNHLPDGANEKQENIQSITKFTELQIRLPDGTREKQKFDKHDLLQEVYDFISSKYKLNDFDLKTYNHNIFSAVEYEKTLEDLDLTPNGVIIVVYKNVVPFNGTNNLYKTFQYYGFWFWFGKVTPFIQYVQGLLSAFWNSFFASGNRNPNQISNQGEGSQSSSNRNTSNRGNRTSARFGNIHTLRRNEDSDDENNRYNGNSTQQK